MVLVFDLGLVTGQLMKKVSILLSRGLSAQLRRLKRIAVTICTNTKGQPCTLSGFSAAFGKKTRSIGTTVVTFHDLRKTAVINAATDGDDS